MTDLSVTQPEGLGLEGRCILVTGAGRGLGRAHALLLARHGARVVVHDAGVEKTGLSPDPAIAEEVAAEIAEQGGEAMAVTELLDGAAACRRAVEAGLERFGRLDGLIHSAGLVAWCDSAEVDEALYRRVTAVNSDAAFWLCAAALPAMRQAGFGRILLTTSGWALGGYPGSGELALYCHGKGAQLGLAMALARDAGHPEIFCNLLSPVANTRMYSGAVPPGRLRPEAVAGAAAWLVSPACRLTGSLVKAQDGSLTLSRLTDGESLDLGAAADDPVSAGRALTSLAEASTAAA